MEFEIATKWMSFASLAISLIVGMITIYTRSTKPFDDRLDAQDKKIKDQGDEMKSHDRRIQKVEDIVPHLPTKEEVHAIRLLIAEMNGQIGKMDGTVTATQRAVQRIDDYLRETGK